MPTLMSQTTFDTLRRVRNEMASDKSLPVPPSYVHLPWAGERLIAERRGIYYVGIATNASEADGDPAFAEALASTEQFCINPNAGGSAFWGFLGALTTELLGERHDRTQERWGWSNLLKIAGSEGPPSKWAHAFAERQRAVCIAALREELAPLRDSLIVITSAEDYGILYEAVAGREHWDTAARPGQTFQFHDQDTGNAFVHAYHPNFFRKPEFWHAAVNEIVTFAGSTLPPFPGIRLAAE